MCPTIGEVNFLVNFDSMNQSFKKTLTDAMKDVQMGVSPDLERKVDEIRSNLLNRLRTPFSGDMRNLIASFPGEMNWWASGGGKEGFLKEMLTSKSGKGWLEPFENKEEIAQKVTENIGKKYREMLLEVMKTGGDPNRVIEMQNMLNLISTKGFHHLITKVIKAAVPEYELEKTRREVHLSRGALIGPQRQWYGLTESGAGAISGEKGFPVKGMESLIVNMVWAMRNLEKKEAFQLIQGDPERAKISQYNEAQIQALENLMGGKFKFQPGLSFPNILMNLWKQHKQISGDFQQKAGGTRADILGIQEMGSEQAMIDLEKEEEKWFVDKKRLPAWWRKKQLSEWRQAKKWFMIVEEVKVQGTEAEAISKERAQMDRSRYIPIVGGSGGLSEMDIKTTPKGASEEIQVLAKLEAQSQDLKQLIELAKQHDVKIEGGFAELEKNKTEIDTEIEKRKGMTTKEG